MLIKIIYRKYLDQKYAKVISVKYIKYFSFSFQSYICMCYHFTKHLLMCIETTYVINLFFIFIFLSIINLICTQNINIFIPLLRIYLFCQEIQRPFGNISNPIKYMINTYSVSASTCLICIQNFMQIGPLYHKAAMEIIGRNQVFCIKTSFDLRNNLSM